MTHLVRDRKKLLNRVSRIRGQLEAIHQGIIDAKDCPALMHNIAGCRGALDGLMAEVIESHIRYDVADPNESPTSKRSRATEELIDVVKTYLR
jgi:DNA-binding FrmR family transcriptional regulator